MGRAITMGDVRLNFGLQDAGHSSRRVMVHPFNV